MSILASRFGSGLLRCHPSWPHPLILVCRDASMESTSRKRLAPLFQFLNGACGCCPSLFEHFNSRTSDVQPTASAALERAGQRAGWNRGLVRAKQPFDRDYASNALRRVCYIGALTQPALSGPVSGPVSGPLLCQPVRSFLPPVAQRRIYSTACTPLTALGVLR